MALPCAGCSYSSPGPSICAARSQSRPHTPAPSGPASCLWGPHPAGLTAASNSPNPRQVDEGVWPPPSNLLNQSPKKVTAESDFNKSLDFEMPPPSPPLNLHELSGPAEGAPATPKAGNPTKGLDAPGKRSVDKAVSVEVLGLGWGPELVSHVLPSTLGWQVPAHGCFFPGEEEVQQAD